MEQSEPLDLCLNIGYCVRKHDDDDVIFVKEYKVRGEKTPPKRHRTPSPRRNPVRKARTNKRFLEYAPIKDELLEDEEESLLEDVVFEDSEEWNLKSMIKGTRTRRRRVTHSARIGRRKKIIPKEEEEDKVCLSELEDVVTSNLLLLKDYVELIKSHGLETEKVQNALEMLKRQAVLVAITKDMLDEDVIDELIKE